MPLIQVKIAVHLLNPLMSVLFLIGLFGAGPNAFAVDVRDPDNFLRRTFSPPPTRAWEGALHCGERQTFFRKTSYCDIKCSTLMCQSQCQKADPVQNTVELAVEDCTTETAFVYGTNNFAAPLTKTDFTQTGTMIQALLAQFDFFVRPIDHIEIKSASFVTVETIEAGQLQNVAGHRVIFAVHPQPNSAALEYEITFVSAPSLLSSLALLRETHAFSDYFLKRKGILNVR